MKGRTSPYAIWAAMKKEAKERTDGKKVMAYININKRVTELAKMELLEELKPDSHTVNIHGRKDYKLTMKGLEGLIPYVQTHPGEVKNIVNYMDKFGIDKNRLALLLLERWTHMSKLLNVYQDHTGILFTDSYWSKIAAESKWGGLISQTIDNFNTEAETLIENITDSSEAQLEQNKFIDKYHEFISAGENIKTAKEIEEDKNIRPIPEQRVLLNYYRSLEIITNRNFHVDPIELYNKILDKVESIKKSTGESIIPNKELEKIISELESTSKKPIAKVEKKH